MGYRSDLYFKCHKDIAPEFFSLLEQCELSEYIEDIAIVEADYIAFSMLCLKWYTGYSNVDTVNAFINSHSSQVAFIRNGEDSDDIETRGNTYDLGLDYYVQFYVEGVEGDSIEYDTLRANLAASKPEYFI